MKCRAYRVFGLLTLMMLAVPERAIADPALVHVTGTSVNLRAAATTAADKLTTARRGDKLDVLAREGVWVQVRTATGEIGWVHGDFVAEHPPAAVAPRPARGPSSAEIRKRLIAASIAEYSGSCPCPYHSDRAGRSCGRRSAYSRPGGYAPLCYPRDVSDEMVEQYRSASGE